MADLFKKRRLQKRLERWQRQTPAGEVTVFQTRSQYHRISVVEKGGRRFLKFGHLPQTAIDIENGFSSCLPYVNYLHLPLAINPEGKKALLIGLGGGALPKRMWRDYPELEIEVVEIDPVVVEVARSYFGLPQDPRLTVTVGDGRDYVASTGKVFDYVIIDAFRSESVPDQLVTEDFMRQVKGRLTPEGVLTYNLIGAVQGHQSGPFLKIRQCVSEIWKKTFVFPLGLAKSSDPDRIRNIILLATDTEISRETLENRIKGRAGGRVTVPGFPNFRFDLY